MLVQTSVSTNFSATRAALPSRCARTTRLLDEVDYRRIETHADKDMILRLRHESYVRYNVVAPTRHKRLIDRFDDLDNGSLFAAFIGGKLASSLRIHVLAHEQPESPAFDAYPDVLGPEIEAGKTFIDPNRFVADYAMARAYPEIPYITLRLFYMAAIFFGADAVTATVRLRHQAFYQRGFGFRTVCPPRSYPQINSPVVLMLLDFKAERERIAQRHPYFRSSPTERSSLFEWAGQRFMPLPGRAVPASIDQAAA